MDQISEIKQVNDQKTEITEYTIPADFLQPAQAKVDQENEQNQRPTQAQQRHLK